MDGEHAAPEPRRVNGRAHGPVPTPIALAAVEYARAGWSLVKLPPRSKGEFRNGADAMTKGWNRRENAVTNPADVLGWHGNFGVLLAFSGLVSVDVDDEVQAAVWFAARGVGYWAMKRGTENVGIVSGRPNHFKFLFRVPPGMEPQALPTHRIYGENGRDVILEFRCADTSGGSVQDVLPPSIHPATGLPYEWHGDWCAIPLMPGWLWALWQGFDNATRPRGERGPLGHGSGADIRDMFERLERAGCKPYWTRPGDMRAHCPVHFGNSGTAFHVNEKIDGTVMFYCHAGCTQEAVMEKLGWGTGHDVPMGRAPMNASSSAQEADDAEPGPAYLPGWPAPLCALPGRLGEVQGCIESVMLRPHPAVAGVTALALIYMLAMPHTRIASRSGLGMGEQFLILAPTAFGKETLRLPFRQLAEWVVGKRITLPDVHFNAPASQQALQEMLIANRCVVMLADEFAEWIAKGEKDQCREQAMGHMMQVHGNPFGTVATPPAVTRKLEAVKNARLLLFGTSTAERFSEVVNGSMADRGFLNRCVIVPVGNDELALNSDLDRPASAYELSPVLRALAVDISGGEKLVTFDADAKAYADAHFRAVLDPLALRDPRLAGRLNEKSIRIAAALALSRGDLTIGVRDMEIAYEIIEGLYARTAAMFTADASLAGDHPTVQALTQLRRTFTRKPFIYRCHLGNHSRVYAKLDVRGQESVVRALVKEGAVKDDGAKLTSLIFVDAVDGL